MNVHYDYFKIFFYYINRRRAYHIGKPLSPRKVPASSRFYNLGAMAAAHPKLFSSAHAACSVAPTSPSAVGRIAVCSFLIISLFFLLILAFVPSLGILFLLSMRHVNSYLENYSGRSDIPRCLSHVVFLLPEFLPSILLLDLFYYILFACICQHKV